MTVSGIFDLRPTGEAEQLHLQPELAELLSRGHCKLLFRNPSPALLLH
jgi:hypothetical protein